MSLSFFTPAVLSFPVQLPEFIDVQTNLSAESGSFFVVQFVAGVSPSAIAIVRHRLRLPLAAINASAKYKLIAIKVKNGIADGVWWVDGYVYNPGQVNIEFTSQGQGSGSGELKTFSGVVEVSDLPAQRRVVAIALDGTPELLAEATSDAVTGQYTLSWLGYSGQILVTAMDDYGVPHIAGEARGVGERIHPGSPTGYVYQVSAAGELGAEPSWPTTDGATVISGTVIMTAVPYYRPKSAGPFTV